MMLKKSSPRKGTSLARTLDRKSAITQKCIQLTSRLDKEGTKNQLYFGVLGEKRPLNGKIRSPPFICSRQV